MDPENDEVLPASETLVPIGWGGRAELDAMANLLRESGIATRIDTHPPGFPPENPTGQLGSSGHSVRLALYVEPESFDRAAPLAQDFAARRMHRSDLPSAQLGTEFDACPACGERTQEGAAGCQACGLAFTIGWESCNVCGGFVAIDADRCSSCQQTRSDPDA